jgi:MFS family permease
LFSIPIEGPFLLATRGMDNPALIGFVMGAMGLVAAVSAATYGWVSRRLDYAQQILLVFVLFLASSAMIALTNNVPFTGAGIVFAGISGGLLSPLLIAMLIRRVDARHITTAIGLFASTMFTSQLLDPFLFKAITAALPINPFIATMAICTVGVSVSLLHSTRNALFHRSKAV